MRPGSVSAASVSVSTMSSSNSLLLSIAAHRYLHWLAELQRSIEAVSDDAYTLDRLLRQGVLPLRQRTGAAPTAVEARLRTAMCQLLLGVESLRSGPHAPPHRSIWASPAPSTGSSLAIMTHAEAPSCPCRAYLEQLQREAESRQFADHNGTSSSSSTCISTSRSSSAADKEKEDEEASSSNSGASTGEDGNGAAQPRLSATISHFTSRLKDAVRKSSGGGDGGSAGGELAEKLLARTMTLGRSSRHHKASPHARRGQPLSDPRALPPPVPLLPITVAAGPPTPSAAALDKPKEDAAVTPPVDPPVLPVPVDGTTQGNRTLHPMLAHISPDELRRCPVCSAQLLLQGAWHAVYQLELLALLSAAPAMAAPLPLPPPSVLRLHPTEGLLLLLHAAHRCLMVGTAMVMTVGVPARAEATAEQRQPVLSALDVLRGVTVASAAAAATSEASGTSAQERAVSDLAGALLSVADTVTGTAAPLLWPREAMTASTSPPRPVAGVAGDVLALRVRLYHTAFVVLMTDGGAAAAPDALADDCEGLVACVRRVVRHPRADEKRATVTAGVVEAETGGTTRHSMEDAGGNGKPQPPPSPLAGAAVAAAERAQQQLQTAFALLDTSPSPAPSSDDATAILQDDLRALCCVAAMLGTFAAMVRAHDTSASGPAGGLCDDGPLLDGRVYPCLLRLQSSSRGDCAAQARHLVALWWLLRGETVRHWAAAAGRTATLRVLEVIVTLREEGAAESTEQQRVQYWQQWLKDASRAAARASDAANEFLGLTLVSTGASPTAPAPPLLRWRLPASPSSARIAFLALPWIRLWVLLCPPLFRVSPADVLALRQYVQHDEKQAAAATTAASGQSERAGSEEAASAKHAKGASAVRPNRANKPHAKPVRDASPTNGRAARPGAHAVPARPANPRSTKKPPQQQPPPPSSSTSVSALPSPTRDCSGGGAAGVACEGVAALMQRRLRASTEPVCFWLRWSLLFLPPHHTTAGATAPADDAHSPLMAALETLCTGLRRPSAVWLGGPPQLPTAVSAATALPATELVRALTHAFPLYTPTEAVDALRAQAHLFLTTRGPETSVVVDAATPGDPRFAAFSFAALLAPLRGVVNRAPERRVSVLDFTAAVPAQDTHASSGEGNAQGDSESPPAA